MHCFIISNKSQKNNKKANKKRFRAAFSAATMHDMFNLLSVAVLLIIEIATHYLEIVTFELVKAIGDSQTEDIKLLKVLTEWLTDAIVKIDSKKLTADLTNNGTSNVTFTLLKDGSN